MAAMTALRILVTRPEPDANRTARHLRALGIEPVIAPMLRMKTLPVPAFEPDRYGAIAITSANAVRALEQIGQTATLSHLCVYAVGDHTAGKAREAGFSRIAHAQNTLASLAHLIASQPPAGKILYLAAHHQSGDLAGLLAPHGIAVETSVLYEMVPEKSLPESAAGALAAGEIAGAVFYSRRTAEVFAARTQGEGYGDMRKRLECLCLSRNCAQPLLESHFLRISLADHPSNEAMMALALAFAREQNGP